MFNQIRAEFYKLFHTKALYLTFALILAVFGIFSIGGQQQFVVSSSSLDGTWKIGETVGFLARAYSDTAHPMIEEIIRTATSYTVFFWLIVLIFSVIFFSREYTDSTIKIAIASGQSRIKFFVAKYIVITITSIFLYFSFIMIAFIIECAKFNVPIQLFPMLKIAGLNCMVMGAFIGITLDFIIRHGNKVIHQRVIDFMEKFLECQPRRFFEVLQIELFFRNHELKAKKKAVVHLIVPNHRY